MGGGELEPVRVERSIEALAPEWDQLADRLGSPPFLRPGWFSVWWQAFGTGELELIVLRRNGQLAGVLPLERRRGVLRGLANYHSPGFGAITEDRLALGALCERAAVRARRRLSLALIDTTGPFMAEAAAAAALTGRRVLTRPMQRTPEIEIAGDWEAYLAGLAGGFRKELRRLRRRLEELGSVDFEVSDGHTDLDGRLGELFTVEATGWKAELGTAIASRPETHRFYQELARWASRRGALRLLVLRLDGEAIAFDYALEAEGVRYMLKGGFDPRYARVSPGILLLQDGLRHAFESGVARVELGGGADSYKLRWSTAVRERDLLQAFPLNPIGFLDWMAFAVGRPLVTRLLRDRSGVEPARDGLAA